MRWTRLKARHKVHDRTLSLFKVLAFSYFCQFNFIIIIIIIIFCAVFFPWDLSGVCRDPLSAIRAAGPHHVERGFLEGARTSPRSRPLAAAKLVVDSPAKEMM